MLPPKKKYPVEAESQPLGTQITYRPFEPQPTPPVDPSIDTNDDQRMLKQHNPNLPQPLDKQYQPGYDPAKDAYSNASEEYNAAAAAPIEKQPLWKQGLYMILQATKNIALGKDDPIQFLGNAKHDYAVGQAARKLGPLQQQKKFAMDRQLEQAQINTIPIDDENKRVQLENQRQSAIDRARDQARTALIKQNYYDPKNPAHRLQAERAGLDPNDLAKWDNRHPFTKQIGDTTYVYKDGDFVPSDLPKDAEKTLVAYDVTLPNGERQTYQIPQKDAAKFAQHMEVVGAQIASREKIAGERVSAQNSRQQIGIAAKKALEEFRQAQKEGNAEKVNELRKQLLDYKNQLQ